MDEYDEIMKMINFLKEDKWNLSLEYKKKVYFFNDLKIEENSGYEINNKIISLCFLCSNYKLENYDLFYINKDIIIDIDECINCKLISYKYKLNCFFIYIDQKVENLYGSDLKTYDLNKEVIIRLGIDRKVKKIPISQNRYELLDI